MKRIIKKIKNQIKNNTKRNVSIRKVILLSTNKLKLKEYQKNFDYYGIEVERVEPENLKEEEFVKKLENPDIISLIKDETFLYKKNEKEEAKIEHLEMVDNITKLTVYSKKDSESYNVQEFEHVSSGFIDLTKKLPTALGVFGWDDIFTIVENGKTYYELNLENRKISSRDMVISKYIKVLYINNSKERFYYKKRIDLNFQQQNQNTSVDFNKSFQEFFHSNHYLYNENTIKYNITKMFQKVSNSGIVFKSSKNRREKNYFSTVVNPARKIFP
jgi:inosine/xanthosine triphosphate pyrophosphatase family protein